MKSSIWYLFNQHNSAGLIQILSQYLPSGWGCDLSGGEGQGADSTGPAGEYKPNFNLLITKKMLCCIKSVGLLIIRHWKD